MDRIAIRRATLEDLDDVAALYIELKRHHQALSPDNPRYRVPDLAWREWARERLAAEWAAAFLSFDRGRAVGLVILALQPHPWGTSCEIETLVVAPWARRSGHGSRLMDAAEDFAIQAGAQGVRLNVLENNAAGRRFYEERGYALMAMRYGRPTSG